MLQRKLPRPQTVEQPHAVKPGTVSSGLGIKEQAEQLIQAEMASLLRHDAAVHPVGKHSKKKKKDRKRDRNSIDADASTIDQFDLEQIEVHWITLHERRIVLECCKVLQVCIQKQRTDVRGVSISVFYWLFASCHIYAWVL